ncbi:MAG TPA: hypothetical protein VN943_10385 [Candidatus Acidoferrum sp.]|nr:hypothetical protein [Candidatus Acidoferrum sp.]
MKHREKTEFKNFDLAMQAILGGVAKRYRDEFFVTGRVAHPLMFKGAGVDASVSAGSVL